MGAIIHIIYVVFHDNNWENFFESYFEKAFNKTYSLFLEGRYNIITAMKGKTVLLFIQYNTLPPYINWLRK